MIYERIDKLTDMKCYYQNVQNDQRLNYDMMNEMYKIFDHFKDKNMI